MKPALTNLAFPTSKNLKQQWNNMKRYWTQKLTQILIISRMKHIAPSIRHYLLQINTTLILIPTNLQLVSLYGHFSSHHVFIHMLHSLPNTYPSWPYKATPFFNFKNVGMPLFMPSGNLFQQKRAGHHTRNSSNNITNHQNSPPTRQSL